MNAAEYAKAHRDLPKEPRITLTDGEYPYHAYIDTSGRLVLARTNKDHIFLNEKEVRLLQGFISEMFPSPKEEASES